MVAMGFVDADTHVQEPAAAWSHFDPGERAMAPITVGAGLRIEDLTINPFRWAGQSEAYRAAFPEGVADLSDVPARLAHMDQLGVDVQVLFSTWWINAEMHSPTVEAAMARSW